jgi:hypothetical protein
VNTHTHLYSNLLSPWKLHNLSEIFRMISSEAFLYIKHLFGWKLSINSSCRCTLSVYWVFLNEIWKKVSTFFSFCLSLFLCLSRISNCGLECTMLNSIN